MAKMKWFDWLAISLLIIGGINWGSYGIFNYDIVAKLFGYMSVWTRIVYGLVGVSALYSIYSLYKLKK